MSHQSNPSDPETGGSRKTGTIKKFNHYLSSLPPPNKVSRKQVLVGWIILSALSFVRTNFFFFHPHVPFPLLCAWMCG